MTNPADNLFFYKYPPPPQPLWQRRVSLRYSVPSLKIPPRSYCMPPISKQYLTDQELIARCAENDRRAQELLYRRFYPDMHRMCMRYTRDDTTAIEIVNNGFLRVFKKIHLFNFKGSLEGWVRKLVYHSMADFYREKARYLHFLVLDDQEVSVPERGHEAFDEEDINTAIRKLPATSREVFRLFAIEGYSHAEISLALEMSEGTSKWHLSNARSKLRELLRNPDAQTKTDTGK